MSELLQHLQALEVSLHSAGTLCTPTNLTQLLHPEFREVGRSGRVYDRKAVVQLLLARESQLRVAADAFALEELAPGVALLTYRSSHIEQDGNFIDHVLRSSIWVKSSEIWQLRYHQGTVEAEVW